MKTHHCDELGVCQARAECHLPCSGPPGPTRYPFAPGVIDRGNTAPRSLRRDLVSAVGLLAVVAVLGFGFGYLAWGGL